MSPLDIFSDEALTSVILKFQNLFKKSNKHKNRLSIESGAITANDNNDSKCNNGKSSNQTKCNAPSNLLNIDTITLNFNNGSSSTTSSCSSSPLSSCSSNCSSQSKKKRSKPNLTIKTSNISKKCIPTLAIPKEHHLTEHLSGDVIQDVFLEWIYTTTYSKFY